MGDRGAIWIICGPLFFVAGALTLYKLYLAYAGRSTRGKHTNYCPETSVKALAKTVAKSKVPKVPRPDSLERTVILPQISEPIPDGPATEAVPEPSPLPVRRAPVEPAFLMAGGAGVEIPARFEDTRRSFTLAELLMRDEPPQEQGEPPEEDALPGRIPLRSHSLIERPEAPCTTAARSSSVSAV
ncbi:hypothetical protein [Amycolatopsis minnesotensis]|uniref:Uncharacterized protein n=1 Tax=Amycolatopsis minnesotensis TaxID=337894 RepID=A0ABN2QVB8_9PSEU